jgi:hypothetical protein
MGRLMGATSPSWQHWRVMLIAIMGEDLAPLVLLASLSKRVTNRALAPSPISPAKKDCCSAQPAPPDSGGQDHPD